MSSPINPPSNGRQPTKQPSAEPWRSRDRRMREIGTWPAIGIGIVAVALTFAVGELIAAIGSWMGLFAPQSSPFAALGAAFIAITPEWLKDFGIGLFGQSDKVALAVVMVATFIVVGALIGLMGRINRAVAAGFGAALVIVTAIAIVTRPDASAGGVVAIALGGAAGIWFLLRALQAVSDSYTDPYAGIDPAIAADIDARQISRRKALQMTGIGAALAIVGGVLSRLVPSIADVQANRAAVRLPPVGADGSALAPGGALRPTSALVPGSTLAGAGASTGVGAAPSSVPASTSASLPPLPAGANPKVPGITPYLTANDQFYRVDTAFTLPHVTTEAWRLNVHGLVDEPFEITWDELLAMPQVERTITLACVSNPVGGNLAGNAVWQGVLVSDLLARAKLQGGADCVYSTSADSFSVATPLEAFADGRDSLLAIGMNGSPLPIEHGFPARLVVPGLYGYVSATKWVVDLEVTKFSEVTGYWTTRGWSADGPIKTASRIDTPSYGMGLTDGVVPVAGVAWAPTRGIEAVQVQVDDEPWQDAELSGVASSDTWRQWVFQWDTKSAGSGDHTLRCRAIDGNKDIQTRNYAPPAPDGASGYHEITVTVA